MNNSSIIKVENLYKSFNVGMQEVPVLKNISLEINRGDFVIIFGPSGCGKSTLLHIILGLEEPSKGLVTFKNRNLYHGTTEEDRGEMRKKYISMVYQQANWIKSINVQENVLFPLLLLGRDRIASTEIANEKLNRLGMLNWAKYVPTELSSGQQQKVSLARALVNDPEVIIADEPTGNLDFESGEELMNLLKELNETQNKTIIMVTHDLEYITYAKKTVSMFNGEIVGIYGKDDKEQLLREIRMKRKKS